MSDDIVCREVRATDAYRLQSLERTPDAPTWVEEVETWAIRDAFFWVRDPETHAALFIGEHDGDLVAVCGYSFAQNGHWYIPALLVEYSSRDVGGFGFAILQHTLDDLRTKAGTADTVTWLVHPENAAMIALSAKVGAISEGTTPITPLAADDTVAYLRMRLQLAD